jgi:cytochrome c biogenesis protein CcmG/thiol:disulfide interchange protein DsbE
VRTTGRATRLPGAAGALLLVGALIALLAYGLVSKSSSNTIDERLASSRPAPAPALELPLLERGSSGKPLESRLTGALSDGRLGLDELRGTPIVLNFWASWCPPCRTEAPRLEGAWRRARRAGVLFLGLNMQDLTGDARDFLDEFAVSYPNVRDQSDDVARRWGVAALPETFFVDRRGRVVGHVIGAVSSRQLRAGIEASRSGRIVGSKSGGDRRSTR